MSGPRPGISIEEAARRAFAETSDPASYVSRPATDRVLDQLHEWSQRDDRGSTVAAIVGTPGLGKTMLLRVAESLWREGSSEPAGVLYLPYGGLEPEDLVNWIYGLLGRTRASPQGQAGFEEVDGGGFAGLAALRGGRARPFFLLVDDADSLKPATLQALARDLPVEAASVRLVLALNPDSKATRLLAALAALEPLEIPFRDRMSAEETEAYLRGRMRHVGFPEAEVARVNAQEARRIHALSAGIPRAVHPVAAALFERLPSQAEEALRAKAHRENWMGRPMEEGTDV